MNNTYVKEFLKEKEVKDEKYYCHRCGIEINTPGICDSCWRLIATNLPTRNLRLDNIC